MLGYYFDYHYRKLSTSGVRVCILAHTCTNMYHREIIIILSRDLFSISDGPLVKKDGNG